MKFSRTWLMPSADTFSMPPVADFVNRWTRGADVIVDPFARNSLIGTHRNDLNPETGAQWHMDAADFLDLMIVQGVQADVVLIDPPYSPRQIQECYASIGRQATTQDTQNARLLAAVRSRAAQIVKSDGCVLSFGWSSSGMGKQHGFETLEILLVPHGGAHNDTICVCERMAALPLYAPVATLTGEGKETR